MFSPMSVGAYIYKSIVGPTGDGDIEDNAKREDATEKEDSSSDSDGGTSADPPGLRASLKRTPGAEETDVPSVESAIIASDTASEEYSTRKGEFSAKLAALPEAEITYDDQMTAANVNMDDGGGASKVLDEGMITLPGDIPTTTNPAFKADYGPDDKRDRTTYYEAAELDSVMDENLQLNDICDHTSHKKKNTEETLEPVRYEQGELELNSDSNSDSYSSTTSDETMTTVRENTDTCQFEPEDRNEFGENNDSWPNEEAEEHMYIAPDLEFPFYKTTVEIEQTINLAEILENMDKRSPAKLPKPKEDKYKPRPVSDEELENALKILRSGNPRAKRSWYSLDNISSLKPNRTFALYFKRRRNSAGDENEPISPQSQNGTVFGLTAAADGENPSSTADEQLRENHFYIPNLTSNGESTIRGPASFLEEKPDNMYMQRRPSDEHFALPDSQCPPETIAFEGPSKLRSVSPLRSSPTFPKIPDEDSTFVPEPASLQHRYHPVDEQPGDNFYIQITPSHENEASPTRETIPETFAFVDPPVSSLSFPKESAEDSTLPSLKSAPDEVHYQPADNHRHLDNNYFPITPPHEDAAFADPKSASEHCYPVDEHQGDSLYAPSISSRENDTLSVEESTSESFEFVDPPVPIQETPTEWDEDSGLPGPELAPPPIAFYGPSKSSPESPPELSPPPPTESYNVLPSEPVPDSTPQRDMPLAPKTCAELPPGLAVTSSSEFAPIVTKEYPAHETPDDFPTPPAVDGDTYVPKEHAGEANDTNPPTEPNDSPMSPEPYISASVKHPKLFHLQFTHANPGDVDAEAEEFSGRRIKEDEQYPVFSMKQKESALIGLQSILPDKKTYPALPPKPNLLKQKAVVENPISSSFVSREEPQVDFSCVEPNNQTGDVVQDDSPMSPEPYISASIKHPTVFCMPPLGSPVPLKVQPSYRGNVVEEKLFPVFSQVRKEQALAELENIIPQRKVPPKVPPKPSFKRRQEVEEPALVSTEVVEVKCAFDFSIFDQNNASEEKAPEAKLSKKSPHPEERNEKDETVVGDDVVIMQAAISVFREEPEDFSPTAESLQISDTGDMSYTQRDKIIPPGEMLPEGKLKDGPTNRSVERLTSREMARMSGRLSLHRLESGEQFTETVISVHEQELEDEDHQSSSSESEDVPVFGGTNKDNENTTDDLCSNEEEDDTFTTEEGYHPSDSFPEAPESFPGASVPFATSYGDHVQSPEFSSSADEFVTEADKQAPEAPKTTHPKTVEERNEKDKTVVGDDVVIMQAGISVYREEPEEFFPTATQPPSFRQTESLQISDTGDMSYIQRDKKPPGEMLPEGKLEVRPKNGSVERSTSREMVMMSGRLSLHRLESGEQFTETVISVHEQKLEDENHQSSSSESEDVPVSVGTNNDNENTIDDLFGSEKGDDTFTTEEGYHPSDSFPEAPESFPGASVPFAASYGDHFESPEFSSSADEFVTEADITISKMTAAINAHNLKEVSSSSSSSSDDSSGSSDSDDDSSFESAEEHTYIVTESGADIERDYYDDQEHGAVSRSTLLPQVIEEGEEDELEEEGSSDHDDNDDSKEEVEVKKDIGKEPEEEKADLCDDDSGENEIPFDHEVAPTLEEVHTQREESLDTKLPSVMPVEVPRYPKYINYDRPKYNIPPEEEEYELRKPFHDALSKTNDIERSSPTRKSPETYPPDTTKSTIQDDVDEESDTSDESDSSEESPSHPPEDVKEAASDDGEYCEETMDFSSEYSDEPEWQPPPPSSGARVFVLTSNMQHPVKVQPRRDLVNRIHNQPRDDSRAYEPRGTNLRGSDPKDAADEEMRDEVREDVRQEADDEDFEKYVAEPDKYFRPINEAATTASKITLEEQARPIPRYSNEERYDGPKAGVKTDASPHEVQASNAQDVRTVTLTYTVIHTKPAAVDNVHHDGTQKTDGSTESCDHLPEDAATPAESETKDDFKQPKESYRESLPDIHHVQPVDAGKVESSAPGGSGIDSTPSYATDLDKYESMYRNAPAESEVMQPHVFAQGMPEREDERKTETSLEETLAPHTPDITHDDDSHSNSKSIPVNEVGPYNYNSNQDQPRENKPDSRGTAVKKTELSREVSLFEISSREQRSPQKKPTSPDVATATRTDDTEDTGSYRFSSWYEEPGDDVPAMAIALVKSDIRLPVELIPERKVVKKPDPKPKPKNTPIIINTNKRSEEDGPYRYTSWYEEPSEEKPKDTDDVVVISSVEANEESSPNKDTPLSPDVEPGTYRYSAWYEEPTGEPSSSGYFVLSTPAADEEKSKSDSLNTPASPVKEPGGYAHVAWYEEPTVEPSNNDYFVVSAPSTAEERSNSASSKSKDSDKMLKEGLYSRSALYEHHQPAVEDPSATFVISRPYEETGLRLPDDNTRPTRLAEDDLNYPSETDIDRRATNTSGKNLSVGESGSGTSSRKTSYGSSRTSGSLADVSATSGEVMRRTWSDGSDEFRGGQDSSAFAPSAVQHVTRLPPQPKPRKGRPSTPSSSDDEQQRQPRRPGKGDGKEHETKADLVQTLSPRAEYALASSAWRQITAGEPSDPTRESVVWDSGDDKRRAIPVDRVGNDNRYSVPHKSRKEIENMLDSLVPNDDAFDIPYNHRREPHEPADRVDNIQTQWGHDASRSMNLLPQTQNTSYRFVETSLQERRFHSTSEPHITQRVDEKVVRGQHPDLAEPLLSLRPQSNEPTRTSQIRHTDKRHPESLERRPVTQDDTGDGPPSFRDEYRLAAASWENMSSASDESTSRQQKMETWDNDPDFDSKRVIGPQSYQPERAPSSSEDAYVPPRNLRGKGNGLVITAEVHAPYAQPPVPGDPQLAVQMLSASASVAELAPPPPTDWGTPRKAHSTLGISQLAPPQPAFQTVIPDAEASVPRRRHRPPGRGPRPPTSASGAGRSHSPVSISTYSSTQSLPARILPSLPRENELKKLKHHIAAIGKELEIKNAELRKIHTRNPSVRHHIPMRGPRGELVSPDGRVLSTPEAPNRAELEKYKRFFDKLPEPHFRRLMHEMLEYKHMVKQKEEEIRRLNTQCAGLRKRLFRLAQQER